MIIVWMVHGTLFDHYDEFFIAVNSSCHDRDIWRDKFVLRCVSCMIGGYYVFFCVKLCAPGTVSYLANRPIVW